MKRAAAAGDPRLVIAFPVEVPKNFTEAEILQLLEQQGYTRIHARHGNTLEVVQDRVRMSGVERARVMEAIEAALKVGRGRVNVHGVGVVEGEETPGLAALGTPLHSGAGEWRFSSDLHCPDCDIHYSDPIPSLFSFNSPIGACETCRGFGRVIGVDYGLVIPDESKTLRAGAIKPWQTQSYRECQDDMEKMARKRDIPLDVPWRDLDEAHRRWVIDGEPDWVSWRKSWPGKWYGVKRFFAWLETKAYKMHIRVLLSRYRAYTPCETCHGARLKPDALLWKVGAEQRSIHDLMLLPIERLRSFFATLELPAPLDEATDLLLTELRTRIAYLGEVGLSYLTLDRQSRTLSGGEVQRINLTTALGTSLVNTLFVLDEPSIGLHPRDMSRVIDVMKKLRDAGNSLVVVEHDPQIMFAADRILDMGPGPGERGGQIVFYGAPDELRAADTLTGQYLSGRKHVDEASSRRTPRSSPAPDCAPASAEATIRIEGAAEHNLKSLDVAFPLQPSRLHHRRVRLGQVDARAGRAAHGAPQSEGQTDRDARRASEPDRRRARRRCRARRPVADRQDGALESGELRRRVRRHPQALCRLGGREGARLHAGDLQLQRRQRPLPGLRRQRFRARRDAVPVGRVSALPRLQRQALPVRGARGEVRRPQHR